MDETVLQELGNRIVETLAADCNKKTIETAKTLLALAQFYGATEEQYLTLFNVYETSLQIICGIRLQ